MHHPRQRRWESALGMLVLAAGTTVAVLWLTGDLAVRALPGLAPPDRFVVWSLPLLRLAADVAAVTTVGCLVGVAFLVPGDGDRLTAHGYRLIRAAEVAAVAWFVAVVATVPLTLADVLGVPLGQALRPGGLANVTEISQVEALLMVAGLVAVVALRCVVALTVTGAAVTAVLALVAVLPPLFTGHAAISGSHQVAVSSVAFHVLAVTVWLGGLLVLLYGRRLPAAVLGPVADRYSRAALVCYFAVAGSGVVNAATRISAPSEIATTAYGRVVAAKTAALVLLGGFGWWHRRRTLPALRAGQSGPFRRFATGEVTVFAVTLGLAVALSRTEPPPATGADTAAAALLGFPMPPPLTARTALFDWYPDVFFLTLAAAAVGLYLAGVRRLARTRSPWPRRRTAAWLLGWFAVVLATSSGLGRYGLVLFSAHVVQYMTVGVLAPIALVLAAPVTLALRSLRPAQQQGVRGPREWLQLLRGSRALHAAAHPAGASALFLTAPYAMYLIGLYELSLRQHAVHLVMFSAALAVGSLFFGMLFSERPQPLPRPAAYGLAAATAVSFGAFALVLASSPDVLAVTWHAALARPWGRSPLADQHLGALLAAGAGVASSLLAVAVLAVQSTTARRPVATGKLPQPVPAQGRS